MSGIISKRDQQIILEIDSNPLMPYDKSIFVNSNKLEAGNESSSSLTSLPSVISSEKFYPLKKMECVNLD